MTTVINLFGGANSGKSTTAAGLYFALKKGHHKVELVREYIKNWVYEGRFPNKWDQPYVGPKQMKYESLLYDKVDYIITDSPYLITDWYENMYHSTQVAKPSMVKFVQHASNNGITYRNFWLDTVPYIDTDGRYQTEEEIKAMAAPMKIWCEDICGECGLKVEEVSAMEADARVVEITSKLFGDV